MQNWSPTTGQNIVARFARDLEAPPAKQKESARVYRARAKGLDRRGEQLWNEFRIIELFPQWSSYGWTLATVTTAGGGTPVTLRIYHNTRYLSQS